MAERVCIDASLALMLLLPHDLSTRVKSLWLYWLESNTEILTAPLFFTEVTSVLRESVFFGKILPEEGEEAFAAYAELPVKDADLPDLQSWAWNMSKKYGRPRAYEAQYLAAASILDCDFWTGDKRLVNAVHLPWVKWVGEA